MKKIIFLYMIILLCSCSMFRKSSSLTEKKESSELKNDIEEDLDIKNINSKTETDISDIVYNGNLVIGIDNIKWSKPDSLGNQYPTETTNTKIGKEEKFKSKKTNTTEEDDETVSSSKKSDKSILTSDTEEIDEDIHQTKASTFNMYWLLFLLLLPLFLKPVRMFLIKNILKIL